MTLPNVTSALPPALGAAGFICSGIVLHKNGTCSVSPCWTEVYFCRIEVWCDVYSHSCLHCWKFTFLSSLFTFLCSLSMFLCSLSKGHISVFIVHVPVLTIKRWHSCVHCSYSCAHCWKVTFLCSLSTFLCSLSMFLCSLWKVHISVFNVHVPMLTVESSHSCVHHLSQPEGSEVAPCEWEVSQDGQCSPHKQQLLLHSQHWHVSPVKQSLLNWGSVNAPKVRVFNNTNRVAICAVHRNWKNTL